MPLAIHRCQVVFWALLLAATPLWAQEPDSTRTPGDTQPPAADAISPGETPVLTDSVAAADSLNGDTLATSDAAIPETLPFSEFASGGIDLEAHGWRTVHVPAGFLPDLEHIRPRVGLALSGGGARGLAHIGVLQVFEEEGVPIDRIVGTSMGAILGSLYAAGYSAHDLQAIAENLDWSGLFSDTPSRRNLLLGQKALANQEVVKLRFRGGQAYIPDALVTGQTLYLEIQRHVDRAPFAPSGNSFYDLPVPLGVMATDLNRGERVLIDQGDLTLALRATMALPVVFRALRFRGQLLVDGGAIENIPVRGALDLGSQVVLGVDCSSPVVPDLDPDLPWEIANQVTTLMSAPNDTVSRQLASLMIRPKLNGYTSTDFVEVQKLVELGREAAEAALPEVLKLTGRGNGAPELAVNVSGVEIVTDAPMESRLNPEAFGLRSGEYTTRQINRRLYAILNDLHARGFAAATLNATITPENVLRIDVSLGVLHEVRVEGVSPEHLSRVLREINLRIGEPVMSKKLQSSIVQLYATGRYATVFRFFERDGRGRLVLTFLLERAPLPRVGFGIGFDTDRRSRYFADLVLPHPFPTIGEEILLRARYGELDELYGLYTRADRLGKTYIGWKASLEYLEREQTLRNLYDGTALYDANVYTARAEVDALFNLRNWGGFSAGVLTERVAEDLSGDDKRMVYNGIVFRATLDTEDRNPFPTRGTKIIGEYRSYLPELGASGFNVFDLSAEVVLELTPRYYLRLRQNSSVADLTTPMSYRFALGGLDDFPAVSPYRFLSLRQTHTTAELRYDLVSKIIAETYLLLRYDVAGFSDQKDWRPARDDLVQSAAFGVALDTFLGPLEVWGAYMPSSQTAEEQTSVLVNLGYRF